ncbi:hypothetical protein ACNKHR_12120 [Shigella flexneri]
MSPFFGYLTVWSYWFMWMAMGMSKSPPLAFMSSSGSRRRRSRYSHHRGGAVALANLAAVRLYGEIEFWFAMIKVTTIIVMIVIGLGVIFFRLWQWRAVDWF